MKKLMTTVIAAASMFSINAMAQVDASAEKTPTQICEQTANNNVSKVRRLLRKENKLIQIAARNIQCNGVPLKQFAEQNNADKVSQYLAKYKVQ